MKDLSRRLNIALIIITHNLGVVARYADRVNVMYAAHIVEHGTADDVFLRPLHPYTIGLMRSVPRLDLPRGVRLETIEGLPPDLRSAARGVPLRVALSVRAGRLRGAGHPVARDRPRPCQRLHPRRGDRGGYAGIRPDARARGRGRDHDRVRRTDPEG